MASVSSKKCESKWYFQIEVGKQKPQEISFFLYLISSDAITSYLLLLLSHSSRVWLCATSETAAHQAPPSLGFSRQEHWNGLPFPSPMHESEKWKWSRSVMSDSGQPHRLQPTRLLRPWDFPGKMWLNEIDDQFKVYLAPSSKHSATLAPVAVFKSGPIWSYRKDSYFFWDK